MVIGFAWIFDLRTRFEGSYLAIRLSERQRPSSSSAECFLSRAQLAGQQPPPRPPSFLLRNAHACSPSTKHDTSKTNKTPNDATFVLSPFCASYVPTFRPRFLSFVPPWRSLYSIPPAPAALRIIFQPLSLGPSSSQIVAFIPVFNIGIVRRFYYCYFFFSCRGKFQGSVVFSS